MLDPGAHCLGCVCGGGCGWWDATGVNALDVGTQEGPQKRAGPANSGNTSSNYWATVWKAGWVNITGSAG